MKRYGILFIMPLGQTRRAGPGKGDLHGGRRSLRFVGAQMPRRWLQESREVITKDGP